MIINMIELNLEFEVELIFYGFVFCCGRGVGGRLCFFIRVIILFWLFSYMVGM